MSSAAAWAAAAAFRELFDSDRDTLWRPKPKPDEFRLSMVPTRASVRKPDLDGDGDAGRGPEEDPVAGVLGALLAMSKWNQAERNKRMNVLKRTLNEEMKRQTLYLCPAEIRLEVALRMSADNHAFGLILHVQLRDMIFKIGWARWCGSKGHMRITRVMNGDILHRHLNAIIHLQFGDDEFR